MPRARLEPQLVMRRADLLHLPDVRLPDACSLRCYRGGDERAWNTIVTESFGAEPGEYDFETSIRARRPFVGERVFFVECAGEPAATASAMREGPTERRRGYLHMVAVRPAHRGRRLGYAVSLAALRRMAAEGAADVILRTDDFRIPAIRTYLRLGFEPVLVHGNQRRRWRAVFGAMDDEAELLRRFAQVLNGPVRVL